MYDTGQMDYDGDQGSGMGGMNVDPNDIFRMFFGGGGGMSSGFSNMGGSRTRGGQSFTFRFGWCVNIYNFSNYLKSVWHNEIVHINLYKYNGRIK